MKKSSFTPAATARHTAASRLSAPLTHRRRRTVRASRNTHYDKTEFTLDL
jgi:hypothetical protein